MCDSLRRMKHDCAAFGRLCQVKAIPFVERGPIEYPMKQLRNLHFYLGVLGLGAFLLTGLYMHALYNHLRGMPDGPRLLYRTAHIYLLWSSLLNLVLGCYGEPVQRPGYRLVQVLASAAVAAGPFLLCGSFFMESTNPGFVRPLARLAIYLALAGVVVHGLCARVKPASAGGVNDPHCKLAGQ